MQTATDRNTAIKQMMPILGPVLDAGDEISLACDLLEMIRMAHSERPDEEHSAVATTALLAVEKLRSAQAMLATAQAGMMEGKTE
jgi:hypothetical protein